VPINIRPMTRIDKFTVMEILRATPEFEPFEIPVAEELLDAFLQDSYQSGYHVLVAEVDRFVAGYACYGPTPLTEGTWDVYWIATAPKKQGQGIGSALIASVEDKIKEAQGRLIIIETSSTPEYEKARRFYLSRGYQVVCQIAGFYAPGDDQVIFVKRLDKMI